MFRVLSPLVIRLWLAIGGLFAAFFATSLGHHLLELQFGTSTTLNYGAFLVGGLVVGRFAPLFWEASREVSQMAVSR